MPETDDRLALDELVERLYKKLRTLAARVRWRGANPSLHPTSLVHDAYLMLMNSRDLASKPYDEVIGIFAHVMRQIMVDAARRKQTGKRGGGAVFPLISGDLDGREPAPQKEAVSPEDVLTLDAALVELSRESPRQASIIECRYFLGMTVDETAEVLGLAKTMVEREERSAKKFLHNRIRPSGE